MAVRQRLVDEAARNSARAMADLVRDLRDARLAAGLTQTFVARACGCSRQTILRLESGRVRNPGILLLARYAAVVRLQLNIRAFPGGSPLRDTTQLATLGWFRSSIAHVWRLHTEWPVDDGRRAFDAMLTKGSIHVAIEVITRLTDVQAQARAILQKADAARVDAVILVLSETRWNRRALVDASGTLDPAFPCADEPSSTRCGSERLPPRMASYWREARVARPAYQMSHPTTVEAVIPCREAPTLIPGERGGPVSRSIGTNPGAGSGDQRPELGDRRLTPPAGLYCRGR